MIRTQQRILLRKQRYFYTQMFKYALLTFVRTISNRLVLVAASKIAYRETFSHLTAGTAGRSNIRRKDSLE